MPLSIRRERTSLFADPRMGKYGGFCFLLAELRVFRAGGSGCQRDGGAASDHKNRSGSRTAITFAFNFFKNSSFISYAFLLFWFELLFGLCLQYIHKR